MGSDLLVLHADYMQRDTDDWGFIGISVSDFDSNYGIAGGHAHEGEEEVDVRIDLQQTRYELRSSYDLNRVIETAKVRRSAQFSKPAAPTHASS